jgi:16S rRNA (cytidine1402-2'-O)-methyltransferase
MSSPGRLYLIPSPIADGAPDLVLPAHTLATVRALRQFVVETPKIARRWLRAAGHPLPIAELALAVLDEHVRDDALAALLAPAFEGNDLGLLSDAGCPGVADPGARLVALAHQRGVRVVPLVGPSSLLLALMGSGLGGQRFAFHGYLPAQAGAREDALRRIEHAARTERATQLFIETPYRNRAMLASALSVLRADTWLCVAADLTGSSEDIVRLTVAAWRRREWPPLDRRPAIFLIAAE